MNDAPDDNPPLRFTAAQARQLLTVSKPNYGEGLSDAQWEQLADSLSAVARLVCAGSRRCASNAVDRKLSDSAPADQEDQEG